MEEGEVEEKEEQNARRRIKNIGPKGEKAMGWDWGGN